MIGSRDSCRILDIDKSTLTRWVQSGKLAPVVKLPTKNGVMLFALQQIEDLAEERRRKRAAA